MNYYFALKNRATCHVEKIGTLKTLPHSMHDINHFLLQILVRLDY